MTPGRDLLREIPSIDRLLQEPAIAGLLAAFPREAVVEAMRAAVAALRAAILANGEASQGVVDASSEALAERARAILEPRFRPRLRRVINATGVVLHTNLGRAPLAVEAAAAAHLAGACYSNLEYDLSEGCRGHRADHVQGLLRELTGAEEACVVNNNAAAVLLILDELARGGEVVVARSELIEIGGSFRLPDVLRRSGAVLVEVGATNKTYLRDYEEAITERTRLLLKTHPSNFRMVGFTHEVAMDELADLGRRRGVPTAMDLGSGVFVDLTRWGLPAEPTVSACVRSGLDLVCFSGDKLLGGPQAGVIVGRAEAVRRCARNPLMRALRCDKMTLAALAATLDLYRWPERIPDAIPALRMLSRPAEALEVEARSLADRLGQLLDDRAHVSALPGHSLPGGGSLPACEVPTWLVAVSPGDGSHAAWSEALRLASPPVIARIEDDRLLLDVRTLLAGDEEAILAAFAGIS